MKDLLFTATVIGFGLVAMWFIEKPEEQKTTYTETVTDVAIEESSELNNYLMENFGYCLKENEF